MVEVYDSSRGVDMATSRWGILGTAGIAEKRLIPALQNSQTCELRAVASRDKTKADEYALRNSIPVAYGSYQELFEDPSIDLIYIPLPNHLHTQYIRMCVEHGKHVLCEKPLALSSQETEELIRLRDEKRIMIGEAYAMYHQTRLKEVRKMIEEGRFGTLRYAHGVFYLTNSDGDNIRNNYPGAGGGSLWDIGVYPLAVGRYLFGEEPETVSCTMYHHEQFKVDHQSTGTLRFPSGKVLSFGCGMGHPLHTHMSLYSDTHRIEIPRTYFSGSVHGSEFSVHEGELSGRAPEVYRYSPEDQYMNECDAFHAAVYENQPFAGSLENTLSQTRLIEALFRAAKNNSIERVQR